MCKPLLFSRLWQMAKSFRFCRFQLRRADVSPRRGDMVVAAWRPCRYAAMWVSVRRSGTPSRPGHPGTWPPSDGGTPSPRCRAFYFAYSADPFFVSLKFTDDESAPSRLPTIKAGHHYGIRPREGVVVRGQILILITKQLRFCGVANGVAFALFFVFCCFCLFVFS